LRQRNRIPTQDIYLFNQLDVSTIDYFKDLSKSSGIPYQNLINLYLRDCAAEKKRLKLDWVA
jgi:hypothetical protein